jgi:hypothetical protein
LVDFPPQAIWSQTARLPPSPADGRLTYGEWLLRKGEWDASYDWLLSEEYTTPGAASRRALALAGLNAGRVDAAREWVRGDSSALASSLLAVACYRLGRHNEAVAAGRAALSGGIVGEPLRAAAVVTLLSTLRSSYADNAVRTSALRTLYSEDEAAVYEALMHDLADGVVAWPSAVASVVPGVGQAANGYWGDAVVALAACGLLGLAAASSVHDDNEAGAVFFGVMFSYAFAANIAAGGAAPARHQEDLRRRIASAVTVKFDPAATLNPQEWLESR